MKNNHQESYIKDVVYRVDTKEWRDLMDEIGGYPKLPYDEKTHRIKYDIGIKNYDLSKEIIYKRVMEWAAINFGSIDAVLHYQDFQTGKIILKGNFDILITQDNKWLFGEYESIDVAKCYQTFIFTIKDNKLKLEITGIEFEIKYLYSSGGIGQVRQSIHTVYPITMYKPVTWKGKLSLLKNLGTRINDLANSIDSYIKAYNTDYDF